MVLVEDHVASYETCLSLNHILFSWSVSHAFICMVRALYCV